MRRGTEELLVLRDPLDLCEPFAIDAAFAPVLDALDGQRTVAQVRQSLLLRSVLEVDGDDLERFVADLGEAGLLDDPRFRDRWLAAHEAFAAASHRLPRRAGLLYPDEPEALRRWLAPALPLRKAEPPLAVAETGPGWGEPPLALVLPHRPPAELPELHRRVLSQLGDPSRYDRVVILATDHAPGLLPFAACDKHWSTPLGEIAVDEGLLATLVERVPWLLREQLRLRSADAVELSCLLLRALWGDRCPPVLALACGQTRLTRADGRAEAEALIAQLELLLGEGSDRGRTLWWTCAELSHSGPAFGHEALPEPSAVAARDHDMLAPLLTNRPAQLAARCMERPASERPSGAAALVTLAELLPVGYRAQLLDYQAVAAPGADPGWIGCAGLCITA